MSKKPEVVFVPDEAIAQLRQLFLEKLEREAANVPGEGEDQMNYYYFIAEVWISPTVTMGESLLVDGYIVT